MSVPGAKLATVALRGLSCRWGSGAVGQIRNLRSGDVRKCVLPQRHQFEDGQSNYAKENSLYPGGHQGYKVP